MKVKLVAIVLCALLAISVFPAAALAYDYVGSNYNDNDFYKMQAFLNLTSDDGVNTNGWRLNPAYDPNDPVSWWYVSWSSDSSDKRITQLLLADSGLAGDIDLSGFASLTYVALRDNSITSVNLNGSIAIEHIDIRQTAITELDASGLTGLHTIYCSGCDLLTSVDVSGCTAFEGLIADNCIIDTLDITGCTALETLSLDNNHLTSLDVDGFSSLTGLDIDRNLLTELNVDGCTALESLNVSYNDLGSLDVSGCTYLTQLDCTGNANMTSLILEGASSLETVTCTGCALTVLDASGLTSLTDLDCGVNDIETLDLTGDTALQYLDCNTNEIESLSVEGFSTLGFLNCAQNNITEIEGLSDAAELMLFVCSDNAIEELDVSGMAALLFFLCDNNELTSLDLSGNTALMGMSCSGNLLTELDLCDSTGISILLVTDNRLSSIKAVISGAPFNLTADGGGYVELYFYPDVEDYYANAVPCTGETFINWTESGTEVSTAAKYDLTPGTEYDLTANFTELELESSIPGGSIYTGGRITLTPSLEGGEWEWDEEYLSATFNSPATFTGLKAGTTQVRYFTEEESVTYDITIEESELPGTGQDMTWVWLLIGAALAVGAAGLFVRRRAAAKTN